MDLAVRFLALLALLGVGVAARGVGLLTDPRREWLNRVAFYVALPSLVFVSTANEPLGRVFAPELVAVVPAVVLAVAGLSALVNRRGRPATRSVAVVQSYHTNLGYLGLPIVAATFGDATTAKASLVLGVATLTQIPITVLVLTGMNDAEGSLRSELRTFVTNPVVLALVAGLSATALGVRVPTTVTAPLATVADLALPVALLLVGGSLSLDHEEVDPRAVGPVLALKLLVMPLAALAAFSALGAAESTVQAGVVMLAMPTAVSTYVYAGELGGDEAVASVNVFATTVASVGTLFVLLGFVV